MNSGKKDRDLCNPQLSRESFHLFHYRGHWSFESCDRPVFSRNLLDAVNHNLGDWIAPVAQGGFEIAHAANSSVDMDKAFTAADLRATASATTLEKERVGNGRTQFVISLSPSVIGRSEHGCILDSPPATRSA